ncbi:MAG: hypothetical protein DCC67_20015, partial [Planctomycetota bacterium]
EEAGVEAPVKRIVLFTSGVGYFEHRGKVEGDASIKLRFDVDDVNDLLKSMVLQDLDGGTISTVTYNSRDPITRTLQSFAVDVTQMQTLGQLLAQLRGQRVDIDAPMKVSGAIVSIERRRQQTNDGDVVESELLTLLTEEGLRQIPVESIGRIKLLDEALDAEFRQALAVLASGQSSDEKSVTLQFRGDGERNVRIGYIQEAPVWKTSYRLVLDEEGPPLLQGWAIVENTSDADWDDVQLSLVSGRPISFVMDLYSPLYAERPVVTPERYASLRPKVYEQDLSRQKAVEQKLITDAYGRRIALEARGGARNRAVAPAEERAFAGRALGGQGEMADAGALPEAMAEVPATAGEALQSTVQAMAAGAEVGELFKYEIDGAVTIARQTSAMLPIINQPVEGSKVSIFNALTHAKHPLDGVRLKNSSPLHLMQGPATVYAGGVYAGDARLPDLAPGGERLLSYALDLDVEVAQTSDSAPQSLVSVKIDQGVLSAAYKQRRTHAYTLKNSAEEAKTVLVEHPIEPGWELAEPKEPTEKTRDEYRFAVEVEPAAPAELTIVEELTIRQSVGVSSQSDEDLRVFLSAKEASDEVKESLREVVRRRTELAELGRQKEQLTQRIAAIADEQTRLRENMQAIDRASDLYARYVGKLSSQEDEIEKLREELRTVDGKINYAQRALDEYLSQLTVG